MLKLLRRVPNTEVIDVNAGCCGMAGSFGYEAEHYEISQLVVEQRLLPVLGKARADAIIVAQDSRAGFKSSISPVGELFTQPCSWSPAARSRHSSSVVNLCHLIAVQSNTARALGERLLHTRGLTASSPLHQN